MGCVMLGIECVMLGMGIGCGDCMELNYYCICSESPMGDSVADNSADAKDEKRLDDGEEKALPVIDWEFAMSQCMDDREFLEELIEEMLKDEESKLAEMQSGVDSDDHDVGFFVRFKCDFQML